MRSPLLQVATAGLLASTVLAVGLTWALPAFLLLAVAAVLLTVIDLRHRLLPDRIVLPTLVLGVVLLSGAALADGAWPALYRAVLGAAALFAVFLALAVISPSGLGMGDVKLAAVLGLFLGWLGWVRWSSEPSPGSSSRPRSPWSCWPSGACAGTATSRSARRCWWERP